MTRETFLSAQEKPYAADFPDGSLDKALTDAMLHVSEAHVLSKDPCNLADNEEFRDDMLS